MLRHHQEIVAQAGHPSVGGLSRPIRRLWSPRRWHRRRNRVDRDGERRTIGARRGAKIAVPTVAALGAGGAVAIDPPNELGTIHGCYSKGHKEQTCVASPFDPTAGAPRRPSTWEQAGSARPDRRPGPARPPRREGRPGRSRRARRRRQGRRHRPAGSGRASRRGRLDAAVRPASGSRRGSAGLPEARRHPGRGDHEGARQRDRRRRLLLLGHAAHGRGRDGQLRLVHDQPAVRPGDAAAAAEARVREPDGPPRP